MFKKIIVAEDFESGNLALQKTLEELKIRDVTFTSYCDDALQWAKKSVADKNPYDLLITDLSFEEDYRTQEISSGEELIIAIRKVLPQIKIIVFSVNKKPKIIEALFKDYRIQGYVSKGRGDSHELKKAIHAVSCNQEYLSPNHRQNIRQNNSIELNTVEINILSLLSQGVLQKNIPDELKKNGISPNSLSSVEKTINGLKISLNANNNEQLIAICKDLGIL